MEGILLLGEFCENIGPNVEIKLHKQFEKIENFPDDLTGLISKIFSADLTQSCKNITSSKTQVDIDSQENYTIGLRFDLEPNFILVYFNIFDIRCRGASRSCVIAFSTKNFQFINKEFMVIREVLVKFVIGLVKTSKIVFLREKSFQVQKSAKRSLAELLGVDLTHKMDNLIRNLIRKLENTSDMIVTSKLFSDIGHQKFKNTIGWILKTLIYNILINKKIIILCYKDFSIPILQNFLLCSGQNEPKTLKFIERIEDLSNLDRNYGAITENKEEFSRIKLKYNEEFSFYDAINSRYYGTIYKKGVLDFFDKRTFTLDDIRKVLVELESLAHIKFVVKKCLFIEKYSENDKEIIYNLSRELFT